MDPNDSIEHFETMMKEASACTPEQLYGAGDATSTMAAVQEIQRLRSVLREIKDEPYAHIARIKAREALEGPKRKCPVCDGVGSHKWNCTFNR